MTENSITVLVGTTKGAFLVSGDNARRDWQVSGPFCNGWPINHVVGDPATGTHLGRRRRRLAAVPVSGASPDGGETWTVSPG